MSQQRFVDKVVIITGSSSGIGQDAAVEFAKEGATVVIHGQTVEKLKETEKLILAAGVPAERILSVIGSLENRDTAEKIIKASLEKFGKIDVLINNAGCGTKPGIPAEDFMNFEVLDFIYEVNLRSVMQLCILALPHLKKTNGNILNISSIASTRIAPPYLFYAVTKAGLDHWTRGFSLMAAPNVRVNALNPGPIETPIFERVNASKELLEQFRAANPLGRFGECSEMSKCMKFLCSDEASYVTGATLIADGGMAVAK